ncbi:hypothetical protein N7509_006846 [Penicillium cosmopolitanum]|uniref:Uncharacterized protein n=1 Tax=Penicillium cosmopolitanum TaxID=1131564 RepID=A0A9X0B7V3_9EURO|nr:uncharacterized protein N7509_006846 [Penicillium cosmopolitanum]KAJ5391356.1 hypothetical protein N7509_006846 [Penicillium cosmopolitanum]
MATDDVCLFNIRTVDSSGEEKLTNRISTEAEIGKKATLGTIRNILAMIYILGMAHMNSGLMICKRARLAFCSKDGARIGDDMSWAVYKR